MTIIVKGRDIEAAADDAYHWALEKAAAACYRLADEWKGTDTWRALHGAAEEIEHLGGDCPMCKDLGLAHEKRTAGDDVTFVDPPK